MSKTYLVGGACRDILLGRTPKDYDYVIVGSNQEEMLSKGFKKVGADFDVYLHPVTGDEFALARTERKSGTGYNGFETNCEGVTLEEDLLRRDLTINSIGIEVDYETTMQIGEPVLVGTWIDPFNGRQDIKDKVLRHTSEAFRDDAVRVLRIARFMARFGDTWSIHRDTITLMDEIYYSEELLSLQPDRVWKETEKALNTQNPSLYFEVLANYGIFPMTSNMMVLCEDNPHHPESSLWKHTAMVMDHAAQTWNDPEVTWAAYCHDYGKYYTYSIYDNGHGHEKAGIPYIKEISYTVRVPNKFKELALLVCEHHQRIHSSLGRGTNKGMRPKSIMKLFEATAAMKKPDRFEKILKCCISDARGRGATQEQIKEFEANPYPQADYLRECLQAVINTDTKSVSKSLLSQGKEGKVIGLEIRAARIKSIRRVYNSWN